jgi:DNA-binding GntR family transcriptional regulator
LKNLSRPAGRTPLSLVSLGLAVTMWTVAISKLAETTLLTDQVYDTIHDAILNGDLPAGARLRIRDLADQVGTSVMPVREAIRRLEAAGLAERVAHKGAVVKGLTLEELVHVYDARRVLEVEASRLGGLHVSATDCDRMQVEYDRMRLALVERRVVDVLDHDEALLDILYTASGNPVLLELIRNLWERCRGYKIVGAQGTMDSGDDESLWRYQHQLVAAARSNDPGISLISEASVIDATNRIKALLAAQAASA